MIDVQEMPVMKKVKQWLDTQFEGERLTSASSGQARKQKRPKTALVDNLMDTCRGNTRNAQNPRYASGYNARDCNCDSCQQNARQEKAYIPPPPASNCNCDTCRTYIPPQPSKCNCDDCKKKWNEDPLPRNSMATTASTVRGTSWQGRERDNKFPETVVPLSVSKVVDCSCDICRGPDFRRSSSSTSLNKCDCDACRKLQGPVLNTCNCSDCRPGRGAPKPFINNLPSQCSSCGCEVPYVQGVFNLEYMGCSLLKVKYFIPKNGLESCC